MSLTETVAIQNSPFLYPNSNPENKVPSASITKTVVRVSTKLIFVYVIITIVSLAILTIIAYCIVQYWLKLQLNTSNLKTKRSPEFNKNVQNADRDFKSKDKQEWKIKDAKQNPSPDSLKLKTTPSVLTGMKQKMTKKGLKIDTNDKIENLDVLKNDSVKKKGETSKKSFCDKNGRGSCGGEILERDKSTSLEPFLPPTSSSEPIKIIKPEPELSSNSSSEATSNTCNSSTSSSSSLASKLDEGVIQEPKAKKPSLFKKIAHSMKFWRKNRDEKKDSKSDVTLSSSPPFSSSSSSSSSSFWNWLKKPKSTSSTTSTTKSNSDSDSTPLSSTKSAPGSNTTTTITDAPKLTIKIPPKTPLIAHDDKEKNREMDSSDGIEKTFSVEVYDSDTLMKIPSLDKSDYIASPPPLTLDSSKSSKESLSVTPSVDSSISSPSRSFSFASIFSSSKPKPSTTSPSVTSPSYSYKSFDDIGKQDLNNLARLSPQKKKKTFLERMFSSKSLTSAEKDEDDRNTEVTIDMEGDIRNQENENPVLLSKRFEGDEEEDYNNYTLDTENDADSSLGDLENTKLVGKILANGNEFMGTSAFNCTSITSNKNEDSETEEDEDGDGGRGS